MGTKGQSFLDESRAPLNAASLTRMLTTPVGPLARLIVLAETESTNDDAREAVRAGSAAHLSAIVADHQTAGKGRSGRTWDSPRGTSLTVSFVLRPPEMEREALGWVPLLVGLAVQRALVRDGIGARLKWPNDVVADDPTRLAVPGWGRSRKVAGILCEVEDGAVIAGVGLNVSQGEDELPVPHASSLALLGSPNVDRVSLLIAISQELVRVMHAWGVGDGEMENAVAEACDTIGRDVVVDGAGGESLEGRAVGLSREGGLIVQTPSGETETVLAGDVRLRAAP